MGATKGLWLSPVTLFVGLAAPAGRAGIQEPCAGEKPHQVSLGLSFPRRFQKVGTVPALEVLRGLQ